MDKLIIIGLVAALVTVIVVGGFFVWALFKWLDEVNEDLQDGGN